MEPKEVTSFHDQQSLGHNDTKATMGYMHVLNRGARGAHSPLG